VVKGARPANQKVFLLDEYRLWKLTRKKEVRYLKIDCGKQHAWNYI
jgi:hypothetical protein